MTKEDIVSHYVSNESIFQFKLLIDAYWESVLIKHIQPCLRVIHKALVERNMNSNRTDNDVYYGDADGRLVYEGNMIIDQTICGSTHYLYVLDGDDIHIRYEDFDYKQANRRAFSNIKQYFRYNNSRDHNCVISRSEDNCYVVDATTRNFYYLEHIVKVAIPCMIAHLGIEKEIEEAGICAII